MVFLVTGCTGGENEHAIAELSIEPEQVELAVGERAQFEALGILADGEEIEVSPEWSHSGDLGRFSEKGEFQAERAGEGRIVASVDDAEAVVKKTAELGGQVTMPVMQILDFGWMTFIQDPSGGHVGIWQKNTHAGAEVVNSPGSFCWHELATRESEAAKTFFANLLGWEYEENPAAPTPYAIIKNHGQQNGGIMQMDEQWGEAPPHWMVYFSVDDIDQSVNTLQELGGTVRVPPFEIPVGRISVVSDPQGGTFTIIQLNEVAN